LHRPVASMGIKALKILGVAAAVVVVVLVVAVVVIVVVSHQ